jgi:hypothetical protein
MSDPDALLRPRAARRACGGAQRTVARVRRCSGAATFAALKSTLTSREALQVRFLAVFHYRSFFHVAWVWMPLGAADAAVRGASRGIAAKNGGEKMTMHMESPTEAAAAVYSIAMRLAEDYRSE